MRPLHFRNAGFTNTGFTSAAVLLAAGMALTGCSSSSSSSQPAPPGTPTASTPQPSPSSTASTAPSGEFEPTTGAGATQSIESNWAMFFNAKTPISGRLALLENGQQFASVIKAQAGSTLALAATSKVTHVTLTGTHQAAVSYEILVAGKVALGGQSGVAVYQDGVWKVGDSSFCGLLKLENAGSSKGLPASCGA